MRASAPCSLFGPGEPSPAGLDEKAGMHCTACGVLIHVKTGLPFGEAPSSPSGQKPENAVKTPASLPPVKKKQPASSGRDADGRDPREASRSRLTAAGSGTAVPAVCCVAWGLALIALGMAFIFPSYGKESTDPLYMLQCLPSMVFGCTAAILFIQGLAAMRR